MSDVVWDMHFMLQKEVVDRLSAQAHSKNYGRLSVMMQYYCQVIPLFDVGANAFFPVPKVSSSVVRLIPHKVKPYLCNDTTLLAHIVQSAFGLRRKTLRNSLKKWVRSDQLEVLDIDPQQRAENLSLQHFVAIANALDGPT